MTNFNAVERAIQRRLHVTVQAERVCPLCACVYVPLKVWHRVCRACKRGISWGQVERAALAKVTGICTPKLEAHRGIVVYMLAGETIEQGRARAAALPGACHLLVPLPMTVDEWTAGMLTRRMASTFV